MKLRDKLPPETRRQVSKWLKMPSKMRICPLNGSLSLFNGHPIDRCRAIFPELAIDGCAPGNCPCDTLGLESVVARAQEFVDGNI